MAGGTDLAMDVGGGRFMRWAIALVFVGMCWGCGGADAESAEHAGSGGISATGGATSSGGTTSFGTGGSSGGTGATGGVAPGGGGNAAGGSDTGGSAGAAGAADGGAGGALPDYPGQAPPGMLVWGAAVQGNGDPVARHETPAGHPLAVRRTYFQWSQRTTGMINIAKDDVAHSRLPWVSIKPPSWAEMAAGQHDAEIDAMLKALQGVAGPVWLTVHHEPEGGGGVNAPDDPAGPAGHVAMNERVRQRMTALGVSNVALAPILMSWTWDPASKRDPEQWWKAGIYDFVGIDHYKDAEATLLTATWGKVRAWAKQKGVDVAVGEWGVRGSDAAAGQLVQEWYDAAADSDSDGAGARVVGLCAFDSNLNSPSGGWELTGAQLTTFWDLLNDPRTADVVP
jgi:hypothetical protein